MRLCGARRERCEFAAKCLANDELHLILDLSELDAVGGGAAALFAPRGFQRDLRARWRGGVRRCQRCRAALVALSSGRSPSATFRTLNDAEIALAAARPWRRRMPARGGDGAAGPAVAPVGSASRKPPRADVAAPTTGYPPAAEPSRARAPTARSICCSTPSRARPSRWRWSDRAGENRASDATPDHDREVGGWASSAGPAIAGAGGPPARSSCRWTARCRRCRRLPAPPPWRGRCVTCPPLRPGWRGHLLHPRGRSAVVNPESGAGFRPAAGWPPRCSRPGARSRWTRANWTSRRRRPTCWPTCV